MISLLVLPKLISSSSSSKELSYKFVSNSAFGNRLPGNFEILYGGEKTSYKSNGWASVFHVNNYPDVQILGSNNGVASSHNVNISTRLTSLFDNKWILIEFIAKNLGSEPCYVSIASYCDIQLGNNDRAYLYPFAETRGLILEDQYGQNGQKTKLKMIVRDGYGVENIDTFWYGRFFDARIQFWNNITGPYPVFDNEIDTAFSLGWKDRLLQPQEAFGILIGVDNNLNTPPTISFANEFKKLYSPGENVEIIVNVKDFELDNIIQLFYNYSNGSENKVKELVGSFKTRQNKLRETMNFTIDLGNEVDSYNLTIWAEDNNKLSNVLVKRFLVNTEPVLKIIKSIDQRLFIDGAFDIYGTIWDDTFSYITYKIDNSFGANIGSPIFCNRTEKSFRRSITLSNHNIIYGKHNITIWATDQFGIESKNMYMILLMKISMLLLLI